MTNILLTAIGGIITANLAPVKNALTTAAADPQAAVSLLTALIPQEIGALPALENEAISAGSTLALEELAKIEAMIAGWGKTPVPTPAPAPAPSPVPATSGSGSGSSAA